jgi:hypothetical protein
MDPELPPDPLDDMPDPLDDMNDARELRQLQQRTLDGAAHLGPLVNALQILDRTILNVYRQADTNAVRQQRQYRRLALISTLNGAFAVFLALLPVPRADRPAVAIAESILAAISLGIVIHAMIAGTRDTWLLERYRAERLRLAKFGALLDPRCWDESARPQWQSKLEGQVEDLAMEVDEALNTWTSHGTVPTVRDAPRGIDHTVALEIRDYYRQTRLRAQLTYLRTRFPEERKRERTTRYAGPILFYASVCVLFFHTLLEFAAHGATQPLNLVMFLGASLPAFTTAVRSHRAVREFGRNALRHEATYHTLRELDGTLSDEAVPAAIFRTIGFCEQVLEADMREWMRLMKEAEQFG